MLAYCTYCSAEKSYSKTPVPAIKLYKSDRIFKVFDSANEANVNFVILSGKYGIIYASEKISYYDHLLLASEVEIHSDFIASQIKMKNISEIVFFMTSVEKDKNLRPYLDCIKKACVKSAIPLRICVTDFQDQSI